MFTGLIESVGTLRGIARRHGGAVITVACAPWTPLLAKGESIAVQGACLTVTAFDNDGFCADMLDETLLRTNLGGKRTGQILNLERALRLGDRLGGHLVSGHVDAVGALEAIRPAGRDRILRVRCAGATAAEIVGKGSVALDGVSLTVSAVADDAFEVCVIPWTWEHTSLRERVAGDTINIETDMVGKYIQRHLAAQGRAGINERMLADAGFLEGNGQ